jgi:uncharacterized FlaG/YvyC family protein
MHEANERKSKSSMGRRKTAELKLDNSESKLNTSKEQFDQEQYSNYSTSDKIRKLSKFLETDFNNVQMEFSRVASFLESK